MLHLTADDELEDEVEADVDETCVEEHGDYEAEPLVRSGSLGEFEATLCGVWIRDFVAREAAELLEGTFVVDAVAIGGGGPWTGPRRWVFLILYAFHVPHARNKTSSHVNLDIRRRADHGVERRVYFDGGASELGVSNQFGDENADLDEAHDVDEPGSLA